MTAPIDGMGRMPAAALLAAGSPPAANATSPAAAARQVEVEFLTQLLDAMRKTIPDDDFLPKSSERQVLDGTFDRSMAEVLSKQDPLGMVRALASDSEQGRLKNLAQAAENSIGGRHQAQRHEDR